MIGLVWAVAFYLWFRDDPAEHPATNQAERQLIAEGTRPENTGRRSRSAGARRRRRRRRSSGPRADPLEPRLPQRQHLAPRRRHDDDVGHLLHADLLVSDVPARGARSDSDRFELAGWRHGPGGGGVRLLLRRLADRLAGQEDGQPPLGPDRAERGRRGAGGARASWSACSPSQHGLASVFVALACLGVQLQVPAWWASATQVSGKHLGPCSG